MADLRSPFLWAQRSEPSIFADDVKFATSRGKQATRGQLSGDGARRHVEHMVATTGRNPGTIQGITRAEKINAIHGTPDFGKGRRRT
jgi:hypothetical protein